MERPGSAPHSEQPVGEPRVFLGYPPPTSSTTYTPNQMFDVVLPHASRGCVRLVAYLMRKTLGWSDENGNPENPQAHVSYRELIELGGIGRGRIKEAIAEAIDRRFIECLRFGQPHRPGEEGFSALYSLRWDEREIYVTDPEEFDGFFAGNGNLTYIPNDFFDYTIPNEPLAVVKVIGVIIRNTIGWQTKFGYRRQQVALSFTEIMRRSGIASRSTVNQAIKDALAGHHIRRVADGLFDSHNPVTATYGILWADQSERVEKEPGSGDGSKIEPAQRFRNRTRAEKTVPKSNQPNGSRIEPGKRSEVAPETVPDSNQQAFPNRTSKKITNLNNNSKQRRKAVAVGAEESLSLLEEELIAFGIDHRESRRLAEEFPEAQIRRQLDWINRRKATTSRTGLLIRAIERDLPEPGVSQSAPLTEAGPASSFAGHFAAELAGNSGIPVGLSSSSDENAAAVLLSRLAGIDASPEETGRAFARHVAKAEEGSRSPVRTLPLAERLFGDAFVAAQEARQRRGAVRGGAEVGPGRGDALADEYEAFVRETTERLDASDAELRSQFDAAMEERVHSRRRMSERASEMLVRELATPEGRARNLAEYLAGAEPDLIPGRAQWEREIRRGERSGEASS